MPIREFKCPACRRIKEVIHPSLDSSKVPAPLCICREGHLAPMEIMISLPRIDTSSTACGQAFTKPYTGPDGRSWNITNLHELRKVEKEYEKTGHNVRFDAWSANPSNPDVVDGYGPAQSDPDVAPTKVAIDLGAK